MKKNIIIIIIALFFTSCHKETLEYEIEKIVEKEVIKEVEKIVTKDVIKEIEKENLIDVTAPAKEEKNISFFLEEMESITISNRNTNDTYKKITHHNGEFYVWVETQNGDTKISSIQKLNMTSTLLTPVISNINGEIKDVLITNRHILIAQGTKVIAYIKDTDQIDVQVNIGDDSIFSLDLVDNNLIIRGFRRFHLYNYTNIVKENQGNFRPVVQSKYINFPKQGEFSSVIQEGVIYYSNINYQGKNAIFTLNLKNGNTFESNQDANNQLLLGHSSKFYGVAFFNNELFVAMGENGFGRLRTEGSGSVKQIYNTYKGQPINVKSLLSVDNKLYAINLINNEILVYTSKNIIFKKY